MSDIQNRYKKLLNLFCYLKKNSNIDVEYIKDYVNISEKKTRFYPFSINIDMVSKWLNSRKDNIKSILVNKINNTTKAKLYIEDVDYIILKNKNKNKRETFRLLCMSVNTKRSRAMRKYFAILEDLTLKYMNELISNKDEQITQLERDLQKPSFKNERALYIINVNGQYKIGKSKKFKNRHNNYQTYLLHNPNVELIVYTRDITRLESCIKNILRSEEYRHRREFYALELTDIINAAYTCYDVITHFECRSCKYINKIDHINDHILSRHKNNKYMFHAKQIDNEKWYERENK